MEAPTVSVVMPAHQAAQTVGAAVSSVLCQTYRPLELVVVDDGSTDETAAIVAAHGPHVRLIRQENSGVAGARNRGVTEATGRLVAFCDADDILLPTHVEALAAIHARTGGIVTANAYWLFPGGIARSRTRHRGRFPAPADQRRSILESNFVSTMSLFRRTLIDEIGPFDTTLTHAEDWDFWLRAIFSGEIVHHQPELLALYRRSSPSLTSDSEAMSSGRRRVLERAAARGDLRSAEQDYLAERLAAPDPAILARLGDVAIGERRYHAAAEHYRAAAHLVPSEQPLVRKARILGPAPRLVGPLLRHRQARLDAALRVDPATPR